MVMCAIALGKS